MERHINAFSDKTSSESIQLGEGTPIWKYVASYELIIASSTLYFFVLDIPEQNYTLSST